MSLINADKYIERLRQTLKDTKSIGVNKLSSTEKYDYLSNRCSDIIRDYDEDVANGYHYITDNFSAYLEIFYQDLDNGMDGIDYIPKELQPPILMAVEKYMAVAKKVSEA